MTTCPQCGHEVECQHKPALLAAGRLVMAARVVTAATVWNVSSAVAALERAADEYDREIIALLEKP